MDSLKGILFFLGFVLIWMTIIGYALFHELYTKNHYLQIKNQEEHSGFVELKAIEGVNVYRNTWHYTIDLEGNDIIPSFQYRSEWIDENGTLNSQAASLEPLYEIQKLYKVLKDVPLNSQVAVKWVSQGHYFNDKPIFVEINGHRDFGKNKKSAWTPFIICMIAGSFLVLIGLGMLVTHILK